VTQFIAHRGNWRGKETANENLIEYLSSAYTSVGAVECDVQTLNGQLYLGHDLPQEPVELDLLLQPNWFCHAKDIQSLGTLLNAGVHAFWHQEDTVTLTSRGFIWVGSTITEDRKSNDGVGLGWQILGVICERVLISL
jgi:hypothetical protein